MTATHGGGVNDSFGIHCLFWTDPDTREFKKEQKGPRLEQFRQEKKHYRPKIGSTEKPPESTAQEFLKIQL